MVRKRGDIWYYDFMIRRVRYRGAIPEARTKAEAEQAEMMERLKVFEGKYGRPEGKQLFSDFVNNTYLPWSKEHKRSYRSDEARTIHLLAFFAGKAFYQITPMLVEKYKRFRQSAKTYRGTIITKAAINREIGLLSRIFSYAIELGVTDANPCQKVKKFKEDNQRTRYLTADEEKKLLAALANGRSYLRPIVLLALNTGMRKGEILSLRWRDVDFVRGHLIVAKSKTGRPRAVPLNSVIREELLLLQSKAKGEYVFTNPRTGERIKDVKRSFTSALSDAKIEDFHFHDLRHTAATRMAEAGAHPVTIMAILGHSTLEMSARYTHATDVNLKLAVESLAGYGEGIVTSLSQKKMATESR